MLEWEGQEGNLGLLGTIPFLLKIISFHFCVPRRVFAKPEMVLLRWGGLRSGTSSISCKLARVEIELPIDQPFQMADHLLPAFCCPTGRHDLALVLTKLHVFRLTEFSKVLFLDADTLPLKPLSHLFALPSESVLHLESSRPLAKGRKDRRADVQLAPCSPSGSRLRPTRDGPTVSTPAS